MKIFIKENLFYFYIVSTLEKKGALTYTIIVAENADSPATLQYLAPYTGASLAEYFSAFSYDINIVGLFALCFKFSFGSKAVYKVLISYLNMYVEGSFNFHRCCKIK